MSTNFEDLERLTEKQQVALDEAAARVERITKDVPSSWDIAFRPERRRGRGRDIVAWTADGEHVATLYCDVYGNGPLVVGSFDLMHNDSDDDHGDDEGNCDCEENE